MIRLIKQIDWLFLGLLVTVWLWSALAVYGLFHLVDRVN